LIPSVILLLASSLLTGCVTRGYKLAHKGTPPAVPLNLPSAPLPVETTASPTAVVNTVIVYQGPGSWKREAWWDEYVVTVTNRGPTPLVLSDASLHAHNGEISKPGDNPWALERLGKSWWETNTARQTGTYLLLGTGTVAGFGVATMGALAGGGFLAPATGGAAAAIGVGAAAMVALPAAAISTVAINLRRKHQVQDEFARRRLALPLTLAPGGTVQGSLFFRLTPSPRELILHGRADEAARDIPIPLTPLAGLHLRLPLPPRSAAPSESTIPTDLSSYE